MKRSDLADNVLQWLAITIASLSLIITIYYNSKTLKATRLESEINTYLQLNNRYNEIVFTIIQNDANTFQSKDYELLGKNKYHIYELFELLATVESLKPCYREIKDHIWDLWSKRVDYLCSKPAIKIAWARYKNYGTSIHKESFIDLVDNSITKSTDPITKYEIMQ